MSRDSLREENALSPHARGGRDSPPRRRCIGRERSTRINRSTEPSQLLFDGTIFWRSGPAAREDVQVSNRVELFVRDIDASLGDFEKVVGRIDDFRMRIRCAATGGLEVFDGAPTRTEVHLLATALKQQDVVENAESLCGLSSESRQLCSGGGR